jgi:hypothetical protein
MSIELALIEHYQLNINDQADAALLRELIADYLESLDNEE